MCQAHNLVSKCLNVREVRTQGKELPETYAEATGADARGAGVNLWVWGAIGMDVNSVGMPVRIGPRYCRC